MRRCALAISLQPREAERAHLLTEHLMIRAIIEARREAWASKCHGLAATAGHSRNRRYDADEADYAVQVLILSRGQHCQGRDKDAQCAVSPAR